MINKNVPICGQSDARNEDYAEKYDPRLFFSYVGIDKDAPLIVDVGAHQGESIHFFRSIFPKAIIHSIEPDPDNFAILEKIASQQDVKTHNLALSEQNGSTSFFKQSISHLGSINPINKDSKDSLGYARNAVNQEVEVQCMTLDQFFESEGIASIDILKIDVQGHEASVLRGGGSALLKTTCVMVEVSLYDFNKNSEGIFGVEQIMKKFGFELWDISKISKNPLNLRTDWIECVYRKTRVF